MYLLAKKKAFLIKKLLTEILQVICCQSVNVFMINMKLMLKISVYHLSFEACKKSNFFLEVVNIPEACSILVLSSQL